MGDIYGRSCKVLACVGPHAENSRIIGSHYQDLSLKFGSGLLTKEQLPRQRQISLQCREALMSLGKRRYWTRLWIAQEIFSGCHGRDINEIKHSRSNDYLSAELLSRDGGRGVRILCGDTDFAFDSLLSMLYADGGIWEPTNDGTSLGDDYTALSVIGDVVFQSVGTLALASERATRLWQLDCKDPRDRIYGILRIIDLPSGLKVMPDYEKSSFALAVEILPYLFGKWHYVHRLLQALRITLSDVPLTDEPLPRASKMSRLPTISLDRETLNMALHARFVYKVCRDEQCRLAVRVASTTDRQVVLDVVTLLNAEPQTTIDGGLPLLRKPGCIYGNTSVVALAAPGIESRDLLVSDSLEHCGLVLRQTYPNDRQVFSLVELVLWLDTANVSQLSSDDGEGFLHDVVLNVELTAYEIVLSKARNDGQPLSQIHVISIDLPSRGEFLRSSLDYMHVDHLNGVYPQYINFLNDFGMG